MKNKPKRSIKKRTDWRKDLRTTLETNRWFKQYERASQQVRRNLETDVTFLKETERLHLALESACKDSNKRQRILRFFKRFPGLMAQSGVTVQRYLEGRRNEGVRQLLSSYVHHAGRFNIYFRPDAKERWTWVPQFIPWNSFHMKIEKGKLQPLVKPRDDDDYIDSFACGDPEALKELLKLPNLCGLLEAGQAKVALIEDDGSKSLLSTLEEITYSSEALTFILHRKEHPHLFLLLGEKVPNDVLRKAGKVVSAFQREYQKRSHAGRPAKLGKLTAAFKKLREPGTLKQKATEEGGKFFSQQAYLSKLKNELTKS